MFEDLRWLGLHWSEGPDVGGPFGPYAQSERQAIYEGCFEQLRETGFVYPCTCSRQGIMQTASAPHAEDEEPIYPGTCRPPEPVVSQRSRAGVNWRFRIPDGEAVAFQDGHFGARQAAARREFGDFVVWRKDDLPAYQLAVVADDAAMRITEVVRGADLITSTFRQLLLYRALGLEPPRHYHVPLLRDAHGSRLAKRHDALSLRTLRARGLTPDEVLRAAASGELVQETH